MDRALLPVISCAALMVSAVVLLPITNRLVKIANALIGALEMARKLSSVGVTVEITDDAEPEDLEATSDVGGYSPVIH